jgi:hypothetical protein
MTRTAAFVAALAIASPAVAHHGGGTFDNTRTIELKGTLTRLELVNPHSWIYFDAVGVPRLFQGGAQHEVEAVP